MVTWLGFDLPQLGDGPHSVAYDLDVAPCPQHVVLSELDGQHLAAGDVHIGDDDPSGNVWR